MPVAHDIDFIATWQGLKSMQIPSPAKTLSDTSSKSRAGSTQIKVNSEELSCLFENLEEVEYFPIFFLACAVLFYSCQSLCAMLHSLQIDMRHITTTCFQCMHTALIDWLEIGLPVGLDTLNDPCLLKSWVILVILYNSQARQIWWRINKSMQCRIRMTN